MHFQSLELIEPILRSLQELGYTTPTPIQAQSIPIVLGGNDLLGCAQTGTGKTASFAIPILQQMHGQHLNAKQRKIKTLVVTPTRELAIQVAESFQDYGKHLGFRTSVIFGGVKQFAQTQELRGGVDILVATPGRLLDLMNQGYITLQHIEYFVLDEADRMLDMGFVHDVKRIITHLPQKRQSLFFSATMPPEIQKLADSILVNPQKVEVTPAATTADTIEQFVYLVDRGNKPALLIDLIRQKNMKTVLVFTRTKHGADKVVKILLKNNIKAAAIHGNKAQNARQRALSDFKDQSLRVLVATDIAARGIDVDELENVVNYEIPNIAETYVHRIGRTGRAGASGTAYSFCDASERPYLRDIEKLIRKNIPVIEEHPYPMVEMDVEDENKKQPKGRGGQRQQAMPARKQEQPAAPRQNENRQPQEKRPAQNAPRPEKRQEQRQEQRLERNQEQRQEKRPDQQRSNNNASRQENRNEPLNEVRQRNNPPRHNRRNDQQNHAETTANQSGSRRPDNRPGNQQRTPSKPSMDAKPNNGQKGNDSGDRKPAKKREADTPIQSLNRSSKWSWLKDFSIKK